MNPAKISVGTLNIPTYPVPVNEEVPMFVENRGHQGSSGQVYPSKVQVHLTREACKEKEYTAVHLENDYLDVWVLPEIGGRIFAAQDKTTGYDFFYRQHVIKPALIGSFGSWISGGVEFNWPYHHRASGFMPCDFTTEVCEDGSVICWLSEHDPVYRMKGTIGIVLRPDSAYLETRVKLTNRTPLQHSFLWWENAAVAVHEQYQLFFPKDVTYVNNHYLASRTFYPIAAEAQYGGAEIKGPVDISMHKNSRDAASYFACASKFDFFGGYDHSKDCGVVHIADHHLAPGKKMFTWGYKQLAQAWERALTDTDGAYAELMAGAYTDNQPDFSWLEPYETKEFSQFWYPISKIGIPDYANLVCAVGFAEKTLSVQATETLGDCLITASADGREFFHSSAALSPAAPVILEWNRPSGLVSVRICNSDGQEVLSYQEEQWDELKMPPPIDGRPLATEVQSTEELYLAGVHVEQYRDPIVTPDTFWSEALKRNPEHILSLIAMARYRYAQMKLEEAKEYSERAIRVLTKFNARPESGEAYYIYALILEALDEVDEAYNYYYKAAWCGSTVSKAAIRLAFIDLRRGDKKAALEHALWAKKRDALHPMAPAVCQIVQPERAAEIAKQTAQDSPLNLLVDYLAGTENFYENLSSEPAQSLLDLAADLISMGQYRICADLLAGLADCRPDQATVMTYWTTAYCLNLLGEDCDAALKAGASAKVGETYPFRLMEASVLKFARSKGFANADFLLGCLLYSKQHYEEGGRLFAAYTEECPEDYLGWRCLAVACFSHLNRKEDALVYMKRATDLCDGAQLSFEAVSLMDKMGIAPEEKIDFLRNRPMCLDNLFTELAKAYNQANRPEAALDVLLNHSFIPCEGGEFAIANQYMFAYYLLAERCAKAGDYCTALDYLEKSGNFPEKLGAGIWDDSTRTPYRFRMAECLAALGREAEAGELYRKIVNDTPTGNGEVVYYQALASLRLGDPYHARKLLNHWKRIWYQGLDGTDNGYFASTPFFISFVDDPKQMRRAHYLYLCGLVELCDGRTEKAYRMLEESYQLNNENMFCGHLLRCKE